MKKTFITFAIIALTISQLQAQNSFNEEVFTAMMNRLQKDPAFFKNEAAPSFTFISGGGSTATQDGMLKYAENNVGLYKRKQSNLKVSQVGSTGIATGIVEETFLSKENPNTVNRIYKGMFTYTFSQVNGKWLWVSAQHTDFRDTKEADEAAIKSTIEGETNAFKMRNTEKATSYWLNAPYTSHHYTAKGLGYVRGEKVGATIADYLRANPIIDNSPTNYHDYIIRINGNSAWATYISDGTSNGKKVVYNKAAYLEKTNGVWKMGSVNSVEAK